MERKKNGGRGIGKSRGGRDTKIRAVTAEDRRLAAFGPSGGGVPDAAEGRVGASEAVGTLEHRVSLLTDRAYEGGRTRATAGGVGV
ncbi:MAG: hypothetical protein LBB61_03990 [Treponema sp.]|jgi:hypothetical protein|nr:hypothetical protein [Treponema sp.]